MLPNFSPFFFLLPHVVFHLSVELEGLGPAGLAADALDDGQNSRGDGPVATVVLVVDAAAEVVDEGLLDGTGVADRHVVVEPLAHAKGYHNGLVVTEVIARAVSGLGVEGADAVGDVCLRVEVAAYLPAQAAAVQRTVFVEAVEIGLRLFAEQGFFIFHLFVIFLLALAKVPYFFKINLF